MTLCPVAIAVGCRKCPVFAICPATRILGDQKRPDTDANPQQSRKADKQGRG